MENKKARIEKAARVGQCTLGLGPIKSKSMDYFYHITGDYEEAKIMAVVEYLTEYMKFDHEDLEEMEITDTKVSKKGDNILYIVFGNPDIAKNVRRQIGECQNPSIRTREYIPPQLFNRYNTISKFAKDLREQNKEIKTQIRFSSNDTILLTKTRGTDEPRRVLCK